MKNWNRSFYKKKIQFINESSIPEKFAGIFDKHESYRDETRNETHGKIAVLLCICSDGSTISSIHPKYQTG